MDSYKKKVIISVIAFTALIALTVILLAVSSQKKSGKNNKDNSGSKPSVTQSDEKNNESSGKNQGGTSSSGNSGQVWSSNAVKGINADITGAFTGVIEYMDTGSRTLLVREVESGEKQALIMGDKSLFRDKYNTPVTAGHFRIGDIVDVSYSDGLSLVCLAACTRAFEYKNVRNLEIDADIHRMTVSGTFYRYDDNVIVVGNRRFSAIDEITEGDVVHLRGIDNNVYSVIISSGHGYLVLDEESDFVGGTMYIGTSYVEYIEAGMRYPLHQGEYDVKIENGELSGTERISVTAGETSVFPASKYASKPVPKGRLTFVVTPVDAELYIDGALQNHLFPIELEYGEHSVFVLLGGYSSYQGNVTVSRTDERVEITLAEEGSQNSFWPDYDETSDAEYGYFEDPDEEDDSQRDDGKTGSDSDSDNSSEDEDEDEDEDDWDEDEDEDDDDWDDWGDDEDEDDDAASDDQDDDNEDEASDDQDDDGEDDEDEASDESDEIAYDDLEDSEDSGEP